MAEEHFSGSEPSKYPTRMKTELLLIGAVVTALVTGIFIGVMLGYHLRHPCDNSPTTTIDGMLPKAKMESKKNVKRNCIAPATSVLSFLFNYKRYKILDCPLSLQIFAFNEHQLHMFDVRSERSAQEETFVASSSSQNNLINVSVLGKLYLGT